MLHKYCDILAKAAALAFAKESTVVSIARQNSKGVQVLNDAYAGIDDSTCRVGYIAFDGEDEDLEFEKSDKQYNSLQETYDFKSDLRLVAWTNSSCVLAHAQHVLQQMKGASREFEVVPTAISTDSEKIFQEETGKEEGAPKKEIGLMRIRFTLQWTANINECLETGKEECDGC